MESDNSSQQSEDNDAEVWKLYLGGIPVECGQEELETALLTVVADFKATIMKNPDQGNSKGCGFVDVFTKADFKRLLKAKIPVFDKVLQIEEYIVDEDKRKKRMFENNEKSIHVGSLPPEAGNDDLESYFTQFGKVTRAYVIYTLGEEKKSREFGFVQFASKKSAKKVLQQAKHKILDKDIKVTQRHTKNEIKSGKHKDSTKAPSNTGASISSKGSKNKRSKKGNIKNKSSKNSEKAEIPHNTYSLNSGFKNDSYNLKNPNILPHSTHSVKSGRSGNKSKAQMPSNWENNIYPVFSKEVIQDKVHDMRNLHPNYIKHHGGYYPSPHPVSSPNLPVEGQSPNYEFSQYEGMKFNQNDFHQNPAQNYQGVYSNRVYGHTMPPTPDYPMQKPQDNKDYEMGNYQAGMPYYQGHQGHMYYPGQFYPGYFPEGYTVRSQPVKVNPKAASFTYNAETGPNPFSKNKQDASSFHPRFGKPESLQKDHFGKPPPIRQPAPTNQPISHTQEARLQQDMYKLIESSDEGH